MKITLNIPDNTLGLIISGMTEESTTISLRQRTIPTDELKDGAEIDCKWEGGAE
jgi:hypothetical protein